MVDPATGFFEMVKIGQKTANATWQPTGWKSIGLPDIHSLQK